jgi:hypothetical protein
VSGAESCETSIFERQAGDSLACFYKATTLYGCLSLNVTALMGFLAVYLRNSLCYGRQRYNRHSLACAVLPGLGDAEDSQQVKSVTVSVINSMSRVSDRAPAVLME